MTPEERIRLLARHSSGELTPLEREYLFTEALSDQDLFDELFEEDALAEALEDPEVRRAIMAADPPRRSATPAPWRWAAVGLLAASLVMGVVLIRRHDAPEETANRIARAIPPPVAQIEPERAPMPERLEFSLTPAPEAAQAPAPFSTPMLALTPEEPRAAAAEVADTFAAMPAKAEAPALPFTAVVETATPDGAWRALPAGAPAPAGTPLRLALTAVSPVTLSAAGAHIVLLPDQTRHLPLPAYPAGEHEIRLEWTTAASAPRARLMSEAGPVAPAPPAPALHILRLRVQ
jgi:hypothetical protein